MSYTVQLIEKEIKMLEDVLSEWEENKYPEARKDRDRKLKDLKENLEKIKN